MNFPKQSLLEQTSATPAAASGALVLAQSEVTKTSWVTCYGFPVGQSLPLIQQYFEFEKGLVIADYFPKDQVDANFIRVKFQTPKDVAVALGENGRVIDFNGTQIMIGVSIFKDGDLLGSVPPAQKPLQQVAVSGGPRKPTTPWERAMVWIMDL